jgi:hypothetical protein
MNWKRNDRGVIEVQPRNLPAGTGKTQEKPQEFRPRFEPTPPEHFRYANLVG